MAEAHAVLCTGLVNDDVETPDDYGDLLSRMKELNLPMICANPDKMVRKGDRLLYCAGSLAEKYAGMGGTVLMAGKPYEPIYNLALQTAGTIAGRQIEKSKVLAIGDGPETDIKGAADFGISRRPDRRWGDRRLRRPGRNPCPRRSQGSPCQNR